MAVGIHTAGGHQPAFGIDNLAAFGDVDLSSYGKDLSVVTDEDAAVGNVLSDHGLNVTVFDQKHKIALL
jgi:hypothetical protein